MLKSGFRFIICIIILLLPFINNIYGANNNWINIEKELVKNEGCRTYLDKNKISYNDITDGRDKIKQYSMSYNIFNEFVNNTTQSFLQSAFENNYCDVIEYSINKNGDVRSLVINHDTYIMEENPEVLKLYDTFSGLIGYNNLNNYKDNINKSLSENNIQDTILDYAIITTEYEYYSPAIICIFGENNTYFYEYGVDATDNHIYDLNEFKNKFSLKYGKFKYNNNYIDNIKPIYFTSDIYISIRDILELNNCKVNWDNGTRIFSFIYNGTEYEIKDNWILSSIYYKNTGERLFQRVWTPGYPGIIFNDKLYYQIDQVNFVAELLFNKKLYSNTDNMVLVYK